MHIPLEGSKFQLNIAGIAGLLGGDDALITMDTVFVYEGRKWLGWYNTPGSYAVARKYGQLAHSRFWDGLFPGTPADISAFFGYDGDSGPSFQATYSGLIIRDTGHIGHLFMDACESLPPTKVEGRTTVPHMVTVAHLSYVPEYEMNPKQRKRGTIWLASIPILFSLGATAVCGVYRDWYCFSTILFGVIANGVSGLVIGSGVLTFTHPQPDPTPSPNGNGILRDESEMAILIGEEGAVNCVTKGMFSLQFAGKPEYRSIGLCAILLLAHLVSQMLLIPQGSLFGQIMFLASLAVSWAYNSFLSSLDRDVIQRRVLLDGVLRQPRMMRFQLGTEATTAVFVLLILNPPNPGDLLDDLLPDNRKLWRLWKKAVLRKMRAGKTFEFVESDYAGVVGADRELLETLYEDALCGYEGFLQTRQFESDMI